MDKRIKPDKRQPQSARPPSEQHASPGLCQCL